MAGLHPNFQTPGLFKLPVPIVVYRQIVFTIRGDILKEHAQVQWNEEAENEESVPAYLSVGLQRIL